MERSPDLTRPVADFVNVRFLQPVNNHEILRIEILPERCNVKTFNLIMNAIRGDQQPWEYHLFKTSVSARSTMNLLDYVTYDVRQWRWLNFEITYTPDANCTQPTLSEVESENGSEIDRDYVLHTPDPFKIDIVDLEATYNNVVETEMMFGEVAMIRDLTDHFNEW